MSVSELTSIVGRDHARAANEMDLIDGVPARFVAAPADTGQVSALLSLASSKRWSVSPRGHGTQLDLGNPPRSVDLLLSTERLIGVGEHAPGDLVARVHAGTSLADFQNILAPAGQMLAIDPPDPGASIGGLIATNHSGPRRFRYGTIRDLLIGITVVLADGTIAKAGGKVVKNVAGYDLSKLFTGSLGTLGVIVDATFRLHPRPPSARLAQLVVTDPNAAGRAVTSIAGSQLTPTAIEIGGDAREQTVAVLFEGLETAVDEQVAATVAILERFGFTRALTGDAARKSVEGAALEGLAEESLCLKVSHLPADLALVLILITETLGRWDASFRFWGHAGSGILYLSLGPLEISAAQAVVATLRTKIREGAVVVFRADPAVKAELELWGDVGSALPLMRRVKDQFDPAGILNAGRFVGGI